MALIIFHCYKHSLSAEKDRTEREVVVLSKLSYEILIQSVIYSTCMCCKWSALLRLFLTINEKSHR